MKIAVEGCLHGELQKVYETVQEIEEREGYKVDLLLCCGDFQATRNLADLQCMAVPDKYKEMGTFWKYYSGELTAPILTLVIGGNHEASNHFQELPFGGWLCPNVYYLGHAGVVDICNQDGDVITTIGGLTGIYKSHDYLRGRFERPPYAQNTIRSVYHVRNIDEFRLKQMPEKSVDIMLSHDWPNGITDYGNVRQLLRFKPHFTDDIARNVLGSPPAMSVLETLKPTYWFSGHLHCKFSALVKREDFETKFLALDKCLPNRRFLQILDIDSTTETKTSKLKLRYNAKWLSILRSTNGLQDGSRKDQHMPGPGYSGRFDFKPTEEEVKESMEKMDGHLDIPLNFEKLVKAFDPSVENVRMLNSIPPPSPLLNPQTEELCNRLGIDDPMTLQSDEAPLESNSSMAVNLSRVPDLTEISEVTVNEDEIQLDEDSDEDNAGDSKDNGKSPPAKRPTLNIPAPKNDNLTLDTVQDEPKNDHITIVEEAKPEIEQEQQLPVKKTLKRRNAAMYTSNDDDE